MTMWAYSLLIYVVAFVVAAAGLYVAVVCMPFLLGRDDRSGEQTGSDHHD